MIGTIVSMLPVSAKVKGALATLDITKQESNALDEVVAILGNNPLVAAFVGHPVKSVTDAVSLLSSDKIDLDSPVVEKIAGLLDLAPMRQNLAKVVMGKIASSQRREMLLSVLEKVSNAPIPGFGDVKHESAEHFIAEGLIPYLTRFLPEQDVQETVTVHKCPFCNEVFCE
jgi:hypothetical protein